MRADLSTIKQKVVSRSQCVYKSTCTRPIHCVYLIQFLICLADFTFMEPFHRRGLVLLAYFCHILLDSLCRVAFKCTGHFPLMKQCVSERLRIDHQVWWSDNFSADVLMDWLIGLLDSMYQPKWPCDMLLNRPTMCAPNCADEYIHQSPMQVSRKLVQLYEECLQGQQTLLQALRLTLPKGVQGSHQVRANLIFPGPCKAQCFWHARQDGWVLS